MTERYPWYDLDPVKGREKVSEVLLMAVLLVRKASENLYRLKG